MKKILLIQHAAIGDVLMCTPAIRAIRQHFPDAEIIFLVGEKAYDAVRFNPNIDSFIIPDSSMSILEYFVYLTRFFRYNFDIVIDFQRNPRSALISLMTHAYMRISFRGKHRNFAYNIKEIQINTAIYAAINKLQLLKYIGINQTGDYIPDLYISDTDKKWGDALWKRLNLQDDDFIVAVSPVSPKVFRRWNLDSYAEVSDVLISKYNAKVLFTWGPSEFEIVQIILKKMKHTLNIDYTIENIRQLKIIYERASLFIGNDNGPRHIAISAGIPTIGIFSHIYANHWTPPGYKKHIAISPISPGIDNVSVDMVINVIEKFMKEYYNEQ